MVLDSVIYWAGLVAVAAFAITAVLAVASSKVPLIAAIVFAIITAIGGGTIRDVILDVPVFWRDDTNYIWIAIIGGLAAFVLDTIFTRRIVNRLLLYVDGLGAALFGILGTQKVWEMEFGLPLAPIILGMLTAIGGGLIRDVLASRPNLLMSSELYAIPVLLGCTLYVALQAFIPEYATFNMLICFALTFGMRAAAIYWKLSVPEWLTTTRRNS